MDQDQDVIKEDMDFEGLKEGMQDLLAKDGESSLLEDEEEYEMDEEEEDYAMGSAGFEDVELPVVQIAEGGDTLTKSPAKTHSTKKDRPTSAARGSLDWSLKSGGESIDELANSIKSAYESKSSGWTEQLKIFCRKINEQALTYMDSPDASQYAVAAKLLQQQIQTLEEVKSQSKGSQDSWNDYEIAELNYEAMNNLARCMNQMGDIEGSLMNLKRALPHVEKMRYYSLQTGHGMVTVLPELCLNISNAYLYRNDLQWAKTHAERAVRESRLCMDQLEEQRGKSACLKMPVYRSQVMLFAQSNQACGKILEKLKLIQKAIESYLRGKVAIENVFGTKHPLFQELVELQNQARTEQKKLALSRPNGSDKKDKQKIKNFYKNQDLEEIGESGSPKNELTEEDFKNLETYFNTFNDADGLLASKDLGLALKSVGHMPQKARLAEILEEEAAGKSKLTYDEFVAIVRSLYLNKSFQTKSVISVNEDVISIDSKAVPSSGDSSKLSLSHAVREEKGSTRGAGSRAGRTGQSAKSSSKNTSKKSSTSKLEVSKKSAKARTQKQASSKVDMTARSEHAPRTQPKHIVCIGDSLTAGQGAPSKASYPAQLQSLLGNQEYVVVNMGLKERTVCSNPDKPQEKGRKRVDLWGQKPYTKTKEWEEVLNYPHPHVCVMMFGTDDAKEPCADEAEMKIARAEFTGGYSEMLRELAQRYQSVVAMVPPPCDVATDQLNGKFVNERLPGLIERLAAEEKREAASDIAVVNIFEAFGGRDDRKEELYCDDQVHLNSSGYKVVARELYQEITGRKKRVRIASGRRKRSGKRRFDGVSQSMKEIVQPPFNAGSTTAKTSMNRIAQLQHMAKQGNHWRFQHMYTPNQMGFIGYHSYNRPRPRSVYHTEIRVVDFKKRKRSRSRARSSGSEAEEMMTATTSAGYESAVKKVHDHTQKLQQEAQDAEGRIAKVLTSINEKNIETQNAMLKAFNEQKAKLEEQIKHERMVALRERETIIKKETVVQTVQRSAKKEKKKSRSPSREAQITVPPVHPLYGPAVYDYHQHIWTYPYAGYYNVDPQKPPQQEEVKVIELPGDPEPVAVGKKDQDTMVDSPDLFRRKKVDKGVGGDTDGDVIGGRRAVPIEVQTEPVGTADAGGSPMRQPDPIAPVVEIMTENPRDRAARIIARFYKRLVLRRRERQFYWLESEVLLSRKRVYNPYLEAVEIMSLYGVHTMDYKCKYLKFTVFNYRTKQYIYSGTYEKMKNLTQFDIYKLKELAEPSLEYLPFERTPFKQHILCLQAIINSELASQHVAQAAPVQETVVLQNQRATFDAATQMHDEKFEYEILNLDSNYITGKKRDDSDLPAAPPNEEDKLIERCSRFIDEITRIQAWWRGSWDRIRLLNVIHAARTKELCRFRKRVYNARGDEHEFEVVLSLQNKTLGEGFTTQEYELEVLDLEKPDNCKRRQYPSMRLPTEPKQLEFYLKEAVHLDFVGQTFTLHKIKFLRMKMNFNRLVEDDKLGIGEHLFLEFELWNYQQHWCRVYKRIRRCTESSKLIVKDWYLQVIQMTAPHSSDRIIFRRLPLPLEMLEECIQNTLAVFHNQKIYPHPIAYLVWSVKDLDLHSQTYHDMNSDRFRTEFQGVFYLTQKPSMDDLGGDRIIEARQIGQEIRSPLYEVYVQRLVPRKKGSKPYRYAALEYKYHKEQLRAQKYAGKKRPELAPDDPSSSEASEDEHVQNGDSVFWNEQELIKMQLDSANESREYLKVTVTRTDEKQDQDFLRVDREVARWAHKDVEYAYIMENLILRQDFNKSTGELEINHIGCYIRNKEQRYSTDFAWLQYLRQTPDIVEFFMTQDVHRWRNQNVAVSVYNTKYQGGGYLIEAINVDRPKQRAYLRVASLLGMRGELLQHYLDSQVRLLSTVDVANTADELERQIQDQQTGDARELAALMLLERPDDFKERMKIDATYRNWVYEDFSKDNHDLLVGDEPKVVRDYRRLKSEQLEEIEEARKEMRQTRTSSKVMQRLISRFFTNRQKLSSHAIVCLRKWRQITVADTKARQRRLEDERRKKLEAMGEHLHNFVIDSRARNYGSVQCEVDIYKMSDPTYYLISVVNLSSPQENDRVTHRIGKLPDGLAENETNKKKIRNVIMKKLNIIWMPRELWVNDVPALQDIYIDTTVVKKQLIHKIVEVKVRKLGADLEDSEDEDFERLAPEIQANARTDAAALSQAFNDFRAMVTARDDGIRGLQHQLDVLSETMRTNGEVNYDMFEQLLQNNGVTIRIRDGVDSKVDERLRMTKIFFGVFTNDKFAKTVEIVKFCKTIEAGATVNYKRLVNMHIEPDQATLHAAKPYPAQQKKVKRLKEAANWDVEDNQRVAMTEEAALNFDVFKQSSDADGKGTQALVKIYCSEDAETDEYYFSLTIFTNLGVAREALSRVRFGPRFIKRADLVRDTMKLGLRTKFNVAQALKKILKKELESILKVHAKPNDDEWVNGLIKELNKYYGQ